VGVTGIGAIVFTYLYILWYPRSRCYLLEFFVVLFLDFGFSSAASSAAFAAASSAAFAAAISR
jgi:hypothetical protein